MKYKYLAVIACLLIALASLSAPARAEPTQQTPGPHQTSARATLNLLDAVGVFGLSAAGLALLWKVKDK